MASAHAPEETASSPRSPSMWANGLDRQLEVFGRQRSVPRATFALVLFSVAVAAIAMSIDAVPRYSQTAFLVGLALTVVLAVFVAKLVERASRAMRVVVAAYLPSVGGAIIGVTLQSIILAEVDGSFVGAVKDLGGLVDTLSPVPWVLSGVILGGVPALVVSGFLLLAARTLRRLTGHDASEGFTTAFVGAAGLLAAFAAPWVDPLAATPLLFVGVLSTIALLVILVVDSSRIRFLRRVYRGQESAIDVVPRERFANDANLAPLVAHAGSEYRAVLVRIESDAARSYRAAALEPIALVGEREEETLRPLLRRRLVATSLCVTMIGLGGLLPLLVR